MKRNAPYSFDPSATGKRVRRTLTAEVAPGLDHWSHKGLNNRAENSHLPFRKRERTMQGHRSPGTLQRLVSMHSATRNCFSVPSRRRAAQTIRYHRLAKLSMHGKLRPVSPEYPRAADLSSQRNLM
ncbi:DDE-type integrase/transposase/recombinase [Rhizobium leguminosarum]|uniref:DDE-type integrase/transposase/recombinase n=1 Tax=Rhizobium leguminosarum TaxID=384 RepID=UPI0021B0FB02|nr:DDE-type integrase/transposase/recombinase [Rhizobium leguminosarum]